MAKITDMNKVADIVSALYENTLLETKFQNSEAELCKQVKTSILTLRKVKSILVDRALLIPQGHGKSSHTLWNKSKATPTPCMITSVYQEFANKSVKVVSPKEEKRMSLEKALKTLASQGFKGEIRRAINDYSYEVIDLGALEW